MQIAVLILLLVFPMVSQGEVYRWVDENGQIHFGSVPPRVQKPYKVGEIDESSQENKSEATQIQKLEKKEKSEPKLPNEQDKADLSRSQGEGQNTKNTSGENLIKFKPKTEEEKKLEVEREKLRNEKFNALIDRLKRDLGAIKKPQKEETQADKKPIKNIGNINNNMGQLKDEENINVEARQETDVEKEDDREVREELESVEQAVIKDNEKCGFFKSFVENYEDRVKYECPSEHCDILYKKLEKYRNKENQYCGEGSEGQGK